MPHIYTSHPLHVPFRRFANTRDHGLACVTRSRHPHPHRHRPPPHRAPDTAPAQSGKQIPLPPTMDGKKPRWPQTSTATSPSCPSARPPSLSTSNESRNDSGEEQHLLGELELPGRLGHEAHDLREHGTSASASGAEASAPRNKRDTRGTARHNVAGRRARRARCTWAQEMENRSARTSASRCGFERRLRLDRHENPCRIVLAHIRKLQGKRGR